MWVFGYGSLLWYTDFPYESVVPGVVTDHVRRFWQKSPDHRGTVEKPGRTVTLVPEIGGICWGLAYKVPEHAVDATVEYLNFRERAGYRQEKVKFHPDDGSEPFDLCVYISVDDEENIYYTGPSDSDEIAQTIVSSRGTSGSNIEYALRLADIQRRLAPHIHDNHLFEIEHRILQLCESRKVIDGILVTLGYKLPYLAASS